MLLSLLRFCVLLPLLFFTQLLAAQEDCANGIDDDGDGLVDLNDRADCDCSYPAAIPSMLPNPSLEQFAADQGGCTSRQPGGLPEATNQANCLVGWQRISSGTTDSWNAFTFTAGPPDFPQSLPQPLPSGAGVAGFWVGVRDTPRHRFRNGDGTTTKRYREYLAACLTDGQQLSSGTDYRLTFSLGFMEPHTGRSRDDRGDVLISSPSGVELAIYGVKECGQLDFGDFYGCPEDAAAAGYELITTVTVNGTAGSWTPVRVDFAAENEYAGFAIGGSCADDLVSTEYYGYRNYYFIDDVILNERSVVESFQADPTGSSTGPFVAGPVSVEGQTICDDEIILRGTEHPGAGYQWYQDGVALLGATDPELTLIPSLTIDGAYRLRVTLPQGCATSDPVNIQRPILYDQFADSVALCAWGGSVPITAPTQSIASYTWEDGSTGSQYFVSEPGTYSVTVSTPCEQRVESFVVVEDQEPAYRFALSPERPCIGQTVSLTMESNWQLPTVIYMFEDGRTKITERGQSIELTAGEVNSVQGIIVSACGVLFETITIPALTPIEATAAITHLNCEGPTGSIQLSSEDPGTTYQWMNPAGDTLRGDGSRITALTPGTYTAVLNSPTGCTTEYTYPLHDNNRFALSVSATDVSCGGDATALALATGGTPPYRVDWYREADEAPVGRNAMVARDLDRGAWMAEVTDSNGCYLQTPFGVEGPEPLRIAATAAFDSCHSPTAGTVQIQAQGGTQPYTYGRSTDTGRQPENLLRGFTNGMHEVVATDALGCESFPLPVAVTLPTFFELDAGADRTISWGESVELEAELVGIDVRQGRVEWTAVEDFYYPIDDGTRARIATAPEQTTDYAVTFTSDDNCSLTDTVTVHVDTTGRLYAPNAFSPNGDRLNDHFTLYTNTVVSAIESLLIYDRWGNLVWESPSSESLGWDGTVNGTPAGVGVYVYHGEVRLRNGATLPVRGSVHLMR